MPIDEYGAGEQYRGATNIGFVSIFVNLPREYDTGLTESEQSAIENTVREAFQGGLKQHKLDGVFTIQGSKSEHGCVVVTIFLGLIATVQVVKEYSALRESVIHIANDIRSVNMYIRERFFSKSAFVKEIRIEPTVSGTKALDV